MSHQNENGVDQGMKKLREGDLPDTEPGLRRERMFELRASAPAWGRALFDQHDRLEQKVDKLVAVFSRKMSLNKGALEIAKAIGYVATAYLAAKGLGPQP